MTDNISPLFHRWRLTSHQWAYLALALVLMSIAYWGGLQELTVRWNKQEEYSHGYLIPLVTLYFIWEKRHLLSSMEPKAWQGAPLIVLLAVAMLLVGEVSALFILIHYSIVLALIGLSLSLLGWHGTRQILVPLLILLFAVPIPYFIEAELTAKLQLVSSQLGVEFIRFCQIPVFLTGNLIDLGDYRLEVVEACSGLTYLYPLLGFGTICAYLYRTSLWKRIFVVLSTIPIAILLNSFRIGMIGVLVNYWGAAAAEGFLHDFEGWIVFMVCVSILFLEMWILSFVGRDAANFRVAFGASYTAPVGVNDQPLREITFQKTFWYSLALLAAATVTVSWMDRRTEQIPDRPSFDEFPISLGAWQGKRKPMEKEVVAGLGLTDYLLADFQDGSGAAVNFYVAYYASQRKGVSPHSPKVCLPGGGWVIISSSDKLLGGKEGLGKSFQANRVVIQKGKTRQLVYYWFQERGRRMSNEYWMKWYLLKDALLANRTDGALVRFTTYISESEPEATADRRMEALIDEAEPYLPRYIPE